MESHESYEKIWNKQLKLSIKVRDSLEGTINAQQSEKDLTIAEKIDGDLHIQNEIKKVLSSSFDS